MEKTVAQLEDKIKQLHGRARWINDHLPESKQDAAWSANTKELDAAKAQLKALEEKLANAQKAAVDTYVLADATGGAQAAAANSLASMKNNVARLEEKINNQEEEINDLEEAVNSNDSPHLDAALQSKWQALASSRAQLKAAKEKLADAKKGGSAAADDVNAYLLAAATGDANAGADDSVASMEKTVAQLEDKIKQLHGRARWINDHLPESKQDAAWSANTKEEDAYKAKLKAAKEQLANAQKAAVDGYVLAAAAANSASMKNTVARLELQINNEEEEVNDLEEAVNNNGSPPLEAALKSKRQELESSRAQLRAAKAKLASAQSAVVESYVLADAKGGAQAAGADSVASMKNMVARLEEQINNQEEEVNDLEGAINSNDSRQLEAALKSKRQELESSRALLKTVKAKLADAKKAGSAAADEVSAYLLVGATG